MMNILSYVGMDLQSEVCLWTLLGLLRTIFDATLFKVNDNLKQVWQMPMPEELTRPVQRVLRTMISGVILVQCFTLYVHLASYIVLLYPVFLEERPTLVLPWLLLAAIRRLLCGLMSLALGLGTCVLLGPARPSCIKFVIVKIASITPAVYMWFLVFSYYHALKMTTAFKSFATALTPHDRDYGLELAVRRRMTKSLQGEDQLRRKLIASLYGERNNSMQMFNAMVSPNIKNTPQTPDDSVEDINLDMVRLQSVTSNRTMSDIGTYEDWFGNEVALPRDTDRILEQFVLMLLRIGAFLEKDEIDPIKFFSTSSQTTLNNRHMFKCTAVASDDTDTPPHIGSTKSRGASYLTEYPQIFMKKTSDICRSPTSENEMIQLKNTTVQLEKDEQNNIVKNLDSENYIANELTRRMNISDSDQHDSQPMQSTSNLRDLNNNTMRRCKEYNSNKNIAEKNGINKADDNASRLTTLDASSATDNMLLIPVCSQCFRERIKNHLTDSKDLQDQTNNGKSSSSSSQISSSSKR